MATDLLPMFNIGNVLLALIQPKVPDYRNRNAKTNLNCRNQTVANSRNSNSVSDDDVNLVHSKLAQHGFAMFLRLDSFEAIQYKL
jgi:hypothetical protein